MNTLRLKHYLLIICLFSFILFLLGITLPIASIEKFYIFSNEFSIVGSLITLLTHSSLQNIVLFVIIFLFTVLFPFVKFIMMFVQITRLDERWHNRVVHWIERIGHFSMLDVFVIALMVVIVKLAGLVEVHIHIGFYLFSVAIILSIILSFSLKKLR